MSAHDIYHSQFDILGMLSTDIEKTERSDTTNLQYSIVNRQSSIFNSGLSGLGYSPAQLAARDSLMVSL